jgi:pimeloyl-ACP methyl ester carboxylesterase
MAKRFLVFGGWGVGPDILRPLFGETSKYVDVNKLMPALFDGEILLPDWAAALRHAFAKEIAEADGLAGWSTGALIACGLALLTNPQRLVLISATPSFCRRDKFGFGWKPAVLRAMRERLATVGNSVVSDFVRAAGLPVDYASSSTYDALTLATGLHFLEQASLLPVLTKVRFPVVAIHGREDGIVPFRAGEALSEALGGDFRLVEGGHGFFVTTGRAGRVMSIDELL